MRICAVVVSYNRPVQLLACIEALLAQTLRPDILVLDNASDRPVTDVLAGVAGPLRIVRSEANTGGAGGFYRGLRQAMLAGYDAAWLMDDDGVPEPGCLAALAAAAAAGTLDIAGPLVVDESDPARRAFAKRAADGTEETVADFCRTADGDGIVPGRSDFFNGTLVTRRAYEAIGDIKFECFIWGDETDYFLRAKARVRVGTVIAARHRHPANRVGTASLGPLGKIVLAAPGRSHLLYRNLGYIDRTHRRISAWKMPLRYLIYFLGRLDWREAGKFLRYYFDGRSDRYRLAPSRDLLRRRLAGDAGEAQP
jgi:rhamnopyranosyl-N-acetylglucosaminyl-diphospho-decaprenol beta-1,3/1,4-galactofuranosyltransferase